MSVVAIIPARSGSKGIPGKNIRLFGGHPLLAWSIAAGRMAGSIDRVLVSTEDEAYAEIARVYGAEVPFLRPNELAADSSRDIGFLRNAAEWLLLKEGELPDFFVLLRPTTPLRDPLVVDSAVERLKARPDATSLRSLEVAPVIPEKCARVGDNGFLYGIMGEDKIGIPRQECRPAYIFNGYVDIVRPAYLLEHDNQYGENRLAFFTEGVAELDTERDWLSAECDLKTYSGPLLRHLDNREWK
jgi:N-acylneuraminate cytidylyltransferase